MPDTANTNSTTATSATGAAPAAGDSQPSAAPVPQSGGTAGTGSAPEQGTSAPAVDFANPIQVGSSSTTGTTSTTEPSPDGDAATTPSQGGEQTGAASASAEPTAPQEGGTAEGEEENTAQEESAFEFTDEIYDALGYQKDGDERWFYIDPNDPNRRYRTADDFRVAAHHLHESYRNLRSEYDSLKAQVNQDREQIEREREQVRAALRGMKPEELRSARVRAHMAEIAPEYANISDVLELKTPEERQKFTDAMAKAEAAVILEDKEREAEAKRLKDRVDKDIERATEYYKRQMKADTFGVNPGDEIQVGALNKFLSAPSQAKGPKGETITRSQLVFQIAQNVSEEDADIYLEGLKARFHREYRAAAGIRPAQQPSAQPAPQGGQVQDRVIDRNPQPTVPAANPTPPVTNQAPRNLLSEGAAARRRARSDQRVRMA